MRMVGISRHAEARAEMTEQINPHPASRECFLIGHMQETFMFGEQRIRAAPGRLERRHDA
jgi:hypothetical protein